MDLSETFLVAVYHHIASEKYQSTLVWVMVTGLVLLAVRRHGAGRGHRDLVAAIVTMEE